MVDVKTLGGTVATVGTAEIATFANISAANCLYQVTRATTRLAAFGTAMWTVGLQ